MKLFVLFALLVVGSCYYIPGPERHGNIVGIIQSAGYPVRTYTVQTQDGYILDLFRIPFGSGRTDGVLKNESKSEEITETSEVTKRPVVLLFHGMMSSSEDFVIGGQMQSLAFMLVDSGYDVFLGNSRGSTYGARHTRLNPNRDPAFWRFTFDEIGTRDLPVIVDKILSVTQEEKISYVGHTEGATAFYVLLSEQPQYSEKFYRMAALGPVTFMQYSTNRVLKKIVNNHLSQSWIMQNVGANTFTPSNELVGDLQTECQSMQTQQQFICTNAYFLFNGYDSRVLNFTTVNRVVKRVPFGGPVRQFLQLSQLMQNGRFQTYEPNWTGGKTETREYDLSRVNIPVGIFYTTKDSLSEVRDVEMLVEKLPNVVVNRKMDQLTNSIDLLYAENVYDVVYSPVLQFLQQYRSMKHPSGKY